MGSEEIQNLAVTYTAAKLAIARDREVSKSKLELAREKQAAALKQLIAAGFTGNVVINKSTALYPKDFLVLMSSGPTDELVMVNTTESASIQVSCSKVIDQYFCIYE